MRTFTCLAVTMLLAGAAANALGQTLDIPDTDTGAGAIQNPGAGLPGADWQPLFEDSRDPDADLIFEVPVTLDEFPRAFRVDGTGPLTTPNQLIVTCRIGPTGPESDLAPSSFGPFENPFPLLASIEIPLSDLIPASSRVVSVGMDVPDGLEVGGLPWQCGMALWHSDRSADCPQGECALAGVAPNQYEPPPAEDARFTTQGTVPAIP